MPGSLLQIVDREKGRFEVTWRALGGTAAERRSPLLRFADPLTDEDRADLRWYLEEFLSFPYGAEPDKAGRVEQRMEQWGTKLFERVFPKRRTDPDPRSFYQEAVREGLDGCDLAVVSDDPAFLNIPWELLHDPTPGRGYLAPSLGGLFRQRQQHALSVPPAIDPSQPFRILLVVSRPYGARDVPLGTVARPMLEALRERWPRIEVELLRPSTFDALQRRLNERPGHYSLVHFDGHGVFAEDRTASQTGPFVQFGARAGAGRLVFETRDGKPHPVPSADLGQALAACKVPLFVLNACQSAEEGRDDPFASVAAQLVAIGATGVVAMSYSVYASAAGTFVGRLYERLVEGSTLAGAVADGRRALFADSRRESLIGPLPLRDWLVPTVYQQATSFQPVAGDGAVTPVQASELDVARRRQVWDATRPPGRFGFVGRDYDLLRIERALSDPQRPWALLSGVGGTGKTALAYGFARWYHETGGCANGVFVTSFKSAASFARVVGSIAGYGTDFSRYPPEEQRRLLIEHLRARPCLLIWDNVEPVAGYPEGTPPLATEAEQAAFATFLHDLRGGRSRVLVTTRKQDEPWLGVAYTLIETAGLTDRDAAQLAESILGTVGKQPSDFGKDQQYADLLKVLRGHPRSLEIVLPLLRRQSPGQILDALQHQTVADEASLLDKSHAIVFDSLSERARRHLPLIGLFTGVVRTGTVTFFVARGDEQQQVYAEVVGEALDAAGWRSVLAEAARAGLLRETGQGLYALHPTLPPFLRSRLAAQVGEAGVQRLDAEYVRCYATISEQLLEGARSADRQTLAVLTFEEPNLLRALRAAERAKDWPRLQSIIQIIGLAYQAQGRLTEWRRLRDGILEHLDIKITTAIPPRDMANLWLYLLNNQTNESNQSGNFNRGESAYRAMLAYLQSLDDPATEPMIATLHHNLGNIAWERGRLDEAEAWYRSLLATRERLDLEIDAADTIHQLGILAQSRGRLDEAEAWHRSALATYKQLGLERRVAGAIHRLGIIAQGRGRLDEAEAWHRGALATYEQLGLERETATTMNQLGIVAQLQGRLGEGEDWSKRALATCERLGLERDGADAMHQLGIVAQDRGRLDEAEAWYRSALAIFERLGAPYQRVRILAQMGILHGHRREHPVAVRWHGRAYQIAAEYQMPVRAQIVANLALLCTALGDEQFRAVWQSEFPGQDLPLEEIRQARASQDSEEPPTSPS